jgi:hypothetical protein
VTDFNSQHNRAVWFDIPVADLDRARLFYAAVLGVKVHKEKFDATEFCVLDHRDGNGGCLIREPGAITSSGGILVYMNVDGPHSRRAGAGRAPRRQGDAGRAYDRTAWLPRNRAG